MACVVNAKGRYTPRNKKENPIHASSLWVVMRYKYESEREWMGICEKAKGPSGKKGGKTALIMPLYT